MLSAVWIAFAALMLAAIVWDARTYRIPNWISLALVALFAAAALASGKPLIGFWPHLAVAAAFFGLGYLLYAFTGMGAGDAKLAAASGLWMGLPGLYLWSFALALAMTALAFGLIALRRLLPAGDRPRILQKGAPAPLGMALGAAAIAASFSFDLALFRF